jgi:C-terminal processing protease CtpA/Prc
MIEGVPVITRLLDDGAAAAQGGRVGEVVVAVDGEDARVRIAWLTKYISASTPQALDDRIASLLLRGTESSTAVLTLQDGAGQTREISLPRRLDNARPKERDGEVMRILPGNIGYVDLERLTLPEVDAMFERFKDTKAIIFDMRGYPKGTAWAIAPRLSQQPEPVAALFRVPVLLEPESTGGQLVKQRGALQFEQRVPRSGNWRYTGSTVMLIDERAVSQSEHTGLFLRAANGTKFVGSPTSGANGDVTSFFVPGDIRIWLTGDSASHPDGRQLQRVGLAPDVEVRPTIDGVRNGRDEVLERAVDYLNGR